MPGPKVRADYDALKNVAQGFSQQADETAKSLQSLQGQMETLQGGDWVGQGATAFYAEMNDQVLPTIKRLQSALQNSADITQKISQAMKTAEDDAAKVLGGAGAAGALGAAAAKVLGGASAGGGAAGGGGSAGGGGAAGGGSSAAGPAGGATKDKVDPRLKPVQDLIDKGDKDGAIAEAAKQYNIDISTAKGTPKFDASTPGEGATSKDGTVNIGSKAFSSPGWLASSVGHEIVHTKQAADRWYTDAQGTHINEIEAYDWEIKNAAANGLSNAEVAELNKRRTAHYNGLTADNKKIIDGGSYKLPPPKAP